MKPTAVVVDDDALARERLKDLAGELALLRVVGEATDVESAVRLIDRLHPDVAFLDVEIPGGTGLDVARRVTPTPVLVFTTAYERYAVAAFELAAVDYLLKPFGASRFREAVERATTTAALTSGGSAARARMGELAEWGGGIDRIFVRDKDSVLPIPVKSIVRLEADGDYVAVHSGGRSHLVRLRLQDFEERLGRRFLRIHRSRMVNLDHVRSFERHDEARLAAVMSDGTRVVASRARSRDLRRAAR